MAASFASKVQRALAAVFAAGAIALCTGFPAYAATPDGNVTVSVPTQLSCSLLPDGGVVAPSGATVSNGGTQAMVASAYTADTRGHSVDFGVTLDGSCLLTRRSGKDTALEIDMAGGRSAKVGLDVADLDRISNAALMDAAAQGETTMFTVGWKFEFKALQGTVAISGDAKLGTTLTASISETQADAQLGYRWYRDGKLIAGADGATYITRDEDVDKTLKCEVYDAGGKYAGTVSGTVGPIKGPEAFAVFSADDGSLNFYKRVDVPKAGEQFEGKTATEVYTGFDTGVFVQTNTPQNTWVDIETSSPWFNRRDEIISSKVIDSDVRVEQLAYWYTRCTNLTTVDLSKLDASRATTVIGLFAHCHSMTMCLLPKNLYSAIELTDMFYQCKSITKVDLNCIGEAREARTLFGLMDGCTALTSLTIPRQIASDMSYAFSGCNSMDSFAFIEDWDVSPSKGFLHTFAYSGKVKHLNLSKWKSTNAKTYKGMFAACASLESLDISGLSRLESVENFNMFYNCPKLSRVTLGDGFSWRGANNYLPIHSSDTIPGADGKWYAISDKKGYAPTDIPSNKADTYVASPDMLPKETFAVFSEDDGSLNFYHRNIVPTMGSHFEGKTATRVYANFDDKVTHIDAYGHQYPVGPWFEVRDQIKSAKIVDKGIRPIYIDGWFAFLDNCTTISGLRQIDYSRCKSMRYLFLRNTQLTTIDLSGLSLPECQMFGGMFEGCKALKEANLSNITLKSDNNLQLWFMFGMCDNVERIDLSGWNINQIGVSENIFLECKKLREISLPGNFAWQKPDGYLPTPNANHIPGADGYWYDTATGDAYKPEEIPSNKAATYVAVNPVMAPTVTIEGETIYGSTLTAKVSGQPAGTTATSYLWQWSIDGKAWSDSQYANAKTDSITLVDNGVYSPMHNYYRCVVTTTAGLKRVPQGVSAAVWPVVKPEAFAVYSADDNSLSFYKRGGMPAEGSQFEGKTATEVYTGFEVDRYVFVSTPDSQWGSSTAPWASVQSSIERVTVVDSGIRPKYVSLWFANFVNLTDVDVSKLDTSACVAMNNTFFKTRRVQTLDLSAWDVSNVTDFGCMFQECLSLGELNIEGWKARPVGSGCFGVFYDCTALRSLDLSGFDLGQADNANRMFGRCHQLSHVTIGDSWNFVGYGLIEGMDPFLPAPSADIFADVDGKWYAASDGKGYAPADIPSNKADTYYASKSLIPAATLALIDEGKEEDAIEASPEVADALALEAEEGQGENGAAATGKADGSLPATVPGDEEDADDEEGDDESPGGTVSGTSGDTGVNVHGGGDEGCPVGNSVAEVGKDVIM